MSTHLATAVVVFTLTLALTFAASIIARLRSGKAAGDEDLAGRSLNKWLIGLSAGTTGNSGFIVTGAVGLGYAGGVQWLMLPLSWLLGDLIYWTFLPDKLNRAAREGGTTTLSELLTNGLSGVSAKCISVVVSILLIAFLSMYTSAQWLAGEKFLSGIFQFSQVTALLVFGLTIVAYSSLGGFRGSIYTDVVQAVIRILGTVIALGGVAWSAYANQPAFLSNIAAAGSDFLVPFPKASLINAIGFVAGYACAAIGFGLGQPQIVARYFAGSSPEETKAARWIYIGFLQFTWISMTAFGVLLRGVMPNLADPETGLSVFFVTSMGATVTGVIFADVFATIASTSNGILVAIAQTVRRDVIGGLFGGSKTFSVMIMTVVTFLIGLVTIALSFVLPGNVFTIAIDAVSKIGAGLAGPVLIKVFRIRHTGWSLLAAIIAGVAAAYAWTKLGYGAVFNEAGVGIAASLIVNWVWALVGKSAAPQYR